MKIVIQRVKRAKVQIAGQTVGQIETGFLVLVGITHTDTENDAQYLAKKLSAMRIFDDADGKMNLSLKDVEGSVLSVSQFTLYAETQKGNRPSFISAARPDLAKPMYDYFNNLLRTEYGLHVETGVFGADMELDFINNGPVTIIVDSKDR